MARAAGSLALTMLACVALTAPARAAEAVTNGGFESGGSGWTPFDASFCTTNSCGMITARTGAGFVTMGGGTDMVGAGGSEIGQISQQVTLSAPATLTFYLRIVPGTVAIREFLVWIDNSVVRTVDTTNPAFAGYSPVAVDLSPYPGTHTLKLYGRSISGGLNQQFARYDIDDVTLTVPDPPAQPPPPGPVPKPTCAGKEATIEGTAETEIVTGTPGADVIVAGPGDDVVRAGAGNDVVCGGDGNDEIKGAAGKDRLLGETGRDKLNGGGGAGDRCDGGPSRDRATRSCEKSKRL
jgi:Ca2+-binding RTX toxin-like protein